MNPWINIVLLIPAIIIVGIIFLIRIKGKLENKIFLYRHEGIVLQTSLALFKLRSGGGRRLPMLGLALLTGERLVVLNRNQKPVFECKFDPAARTTGEKCTLQTSPDKKSIIIRCRCESEEREVMLNVRNADAWQLEYGRLSSYVSFE